MIYIDTQKEFEEFCKKIKKEKQIGFDCEFIRENTFVPILCLMQISAGDEIYVVDPLKLKLNSFLKILTNKKILKIMHASVQDIDVFFNNFNITIKPIFDTQIAAAFLGLGDNISYAKIINKLCKVELAKASKLTHWEERPLSKAQLKYANDDVLYLFQIYDILVEKLEKENRVSWFLEETDNLYKKDNYYTNPKDAWKRIKCSNRKDNFLNHIKLYAKIREDLAVKNNRPRRFIIKDDILIKLAELQPKSEEEIKKDRILKRFVSREFMQLMFKEKVCKKEIKLKENNKPSSEEKLIIADALRLILKMTAKKYNLAARYIATSDEIQKFLKNEKKVIFMSGWRYEVFGKKIEKFMQGDSEIKIKEDKLLLL